MKKNYRITLCGCLIGKIFDVELDKTSYETIKDFCDTLENESNCISVSIERLESDAPERNKQLSDYI